MADLDPNLSALKEGDRNRYLCALLVPDHARDAISALYAFNLDLARIPEQVSEPQLGEIRLQWWHDLISAAGDGGGSGPVADGVARAIRDFELPVRSLLNMIEARRFDLYHDPMPDRHTFEGYAGETSSSLIQLSATILAPKAAMSSAEAAGHAGIAQLVSGMLLLMPRQRAEGRVFVPGDMLASVGLDSAGYLSGADKAAMNRLVSALVSYGRDHLEKARRHLGKADQRMFAAFLPASMSRHVFDIAESRGGSLASSPVIIPQWKRQWWIWRAARKEEI